MACTNITTITAILTKSAVQALYKRGSVSDWLEAYILFFIGYTTTKILKLTCFLSEFYGAPKKNSTTPEKIK